MRKSTFLVSMLMLLTLWSCNNKEAKKTEKMDNPLLSEWNTPYGVAPFDKIKTEDFLPAIKQAVKEHKAEIDAIVNNTEEPTFKNTLEALDYSGEKLTLITSVFYNYLSANTSDELQEVAAEVSPMLSKHGDEIAMNAKLFERVKKVYEQKDKLELTTEQKKLLDDTYKNFVRGGANLNEADKKRLSEINQKLSTLTLAFGNNVLAETNKYELVIDKKEDLDGLPESLIAAAAETAKEKGKEGKWVFTIQKPSMIPFLTYSKKRELRKQILLAYAGKGDHNDSLDNKENIKQILKLRLEKANLLGFKTHSDYVLDRQMAKNPQNVFDLLNQVWEKALPVAKKEAAELQKMLVKDVPGATLEPWDWWYYSEKLRKEKYDLDEEQLRPYFKLENVRNGMFEVANRLYGITFEPLKDFPVFHPEVEPYAVKDDKGNVIGVYLMDFYPRASKRGGAWMTSYRKQQKRNGKNIIPIISLTTNFTKPTADKPSLLSFEEVSTMFHEFGHSLHGLLSNCTYPSLSGTDVPRDFVEMPSQIMENWAAEPEVLKIYARHYKTNEVIPQALIEKMKNASHFNQGFATVEYMSAAYLDMDFHTIDNMDVINNMDVNKFETESMNKIGLIPQIIVRYRSTYFNHVFSGGYSSGYYSYLWAAAIDADAFSAFKENGIFDQKTALSFRKNILEKGGTEDPMELYKAFRGREPKVDALLERKGFTK